MSTHRGKERRFIGKGAYGSVTVKGTEATKTLKKYSHVVQETMAGLFLMGQDNVVEFLRASIVKKTITMKRYDKTLRNWMDREELHSLESKNAVTKQFLRGLMNIHALRLVHGDIKPGNIFVNEKPLKVVIGDLGFISLAPFSKVERTAAVYRDKTPISCYGHDIYSAGIILLEIYGDLKVSMQADYEQIHEAIKEEISDPKMRRLLMDMTSPKHESRPLISEVYFRLFGERVEYPVIRNTFKAPYDNKEIRAIMKGLAEKYEIQRAHRGYKALIHYINKNSKSYIKTKSATKKYATSMVFVLSSVFGRFTKFNEKMAAEYCECEVDEIIRVTEELCLDREIVHMIMSP
jgi:serine/threonine protein kinase